MCSDNYDSISFMSENIDKNKLATAGLGNSETVPQKEERVLAFWRENKIFEKSLEKKATKGDFVFYDGPPFATGQPHYGHLLQSVLKDVIPRYKTMCGYRVPRTWGWDCHGLPIENLIEKELGLKSKKDIEELGVDKFNQSARDSVFRYADDWKITIPRIGRFVDMENDYKTMDSSYTESIWWVFKTLYDKGLVYLGHKSMHICPRCETTLANFEVSQGYKDITDLSVTVKFELLNAQINSESSNEGVRTYILAWTTTPWTLPGNVALAVGENIDYVKIENSLISGEYLILAKERLSMIDGEYKIIEEFKGKELVGRSYRPLFNYYSDREDTGNRENGWKIYPADFVTTEDGVGVVHIAPAFGSDDMRLGKENNLPFIQHVGMDGRFRSEVTDFSGMLVKPKDDHQSADVLIIKNLAGRGLLFAKEKITHSYPHCWRCDTPLLNYGTSSWFVDVPKIKESMIANNQKINWIPENVRDGRFGKWLEGASDWAISRSRYWGAPLPVWSCELCGEKKVIGSINELKNEVSSGNKYFVLRHGEADSNVKGYLSSDKIQKENHLTENGKKIVSETADKIKNEKIDLIISSDFVRTAETAKIVAEKIGIPESSIIWEPRLRELRVGDFDGIKVEEYGRYFSSYEDRFYKNSPNGENHTDTKNRITEFLFETDLKYKNKNILIVSHGDPIWVMFAGASGLTPKDAVSIKEDVYLKNAEYRELNFSPFPHRENYELDLHKPFIDDVYLECKCGGKMNRIPEVFDCWFESGAMPYGQMHYPFENKETFEKNFPADFIGEALDQTRGWFYSLLVLSTALFDKPAYKNVIATGLILAEDGQKMSKRLKNYPEVSYIINKYGADATRYYLLTSPVVRGEEIRFSEKGVDEVYKKIILRLYNVVSFLEMYEDKTKAKPVQTDGTVHPGTNHKPKIDSKNILDRWILARLEEIGKNTTEALEKYELDKASRPIEGLIDDLSTWYLRRSRDRLKGDNSEDKENALKTICFVIRELSLIMAPFMPFIAEEIYKKMNGELESVHLESWPEDKEGNDSKKILIEMKKTREVVSLGLEARVKAGIKVRQPLNNLSIKDTFLSGKEEYLELIKDELNIKKVIFDNKILNDVELDLNITEELKEEGRLREFFRNIQEIRKDMALDPSQKVVMEVRAGDVEKKFFDKFSKEIEKAAGVSKIVFKEDIKGKIIEVGEMSFEVYLTVC